MNLIVYRTLRVRMAEWSKAPDSRFNYLPLRGERAFWSTNVGVGSNPTSDNIFVAASVIFIKHHAPGLFLYHKKGLYCWR